MKSRTCFDTTVTESDQFLGMSLEAQLCYFHICSEARPSGLIVGAARVARGYGFTMDELDELAEAGYLLEVGRQTYVTHTWTNNRFDSRLFDKAMQTCEPYVRGRLGFDGDTGKSRYVLIDEQSTIERRLNDHEMKGTESEGKGTELKCFEAEMKGQGREGERGRETKTDSHPCLCARCGSEATYSTLNSKTTIRCPSCGEYPFSV